MKTIKPQKLGVATRVFENDRQFFFVASILAFFPFDSPRSLLPEVSLWKFLATALGKDAPFDVFMSKLRGEVLVTGKAFAPGGTPRTACSAKLRIGPVAKELYVVGDRLWERNGQSAPEPFLEMPLTWERAFGGPDFPQNPLGRGAAPPADGGPHLLPNLEDPRHLVRTPKDRPAPVGFGAYDAMWPQRASKVGTYDAEWLETRFPGFARDMDLAYFNTAPDDQQLDGFFRGDEAFTLENMHPTRPTVTSALPGLRARCFVTRRTAEGDAFHEIPMRAETVHLFPDAERAVLIFRGVCRVAEDDAADVLHLVAACEDLAEARPVEHYQRVLGERLDRTRGILLSLRDRDLLPELPRAAVPLPEDAWNDTAPLLARDGLLEANLRRRSEAALERARAECVAAGVDPAGRVPDALPPPMPEPNLEDLPEIVEQATAELAARVKASQDTRAAAEERARRECAAHGLDYDKLVADAKAKGGGPPTFSADAELEKLRDLAALSRTAGMPIGDVDAQLADPELERKLRDVERGSKDAYRRFAHHMPAARALAPEASVRLREDLVAAHARGESLAGKDLTGADLSGIDLAGADLREAMLEAATLRGARLAGACLEGAVLARADLGGADLSGARLAGANLGHASLRDATLADADLGRATLVKADLGCAALSRANLAGADLAEATLADAVLRGASLRETTIAEVDLAGVDLAGADLTKCVLYRVKLAGAGLAGAKLTSAAFVGVDGDGAVLEGADAENLRVVMESSLAGANLRKAKLGGANLRGTRLTGADLGGADLSRADLSECDLRGAKLAGVAAVDARFAKSDLTGAVMTAGNFMQGILQKARLVGADLRGANLFRADLARIRADRSTILTGANVKQARVVALGPDEKV